MGETISNPFVVLGFCDIVTVEILKGYDQCWIFLFVARNYFNEIHFANTRAREQEAIESPGCTGTRAGKPLMKWVTDDLMEK